MIVPIEFENSSVCKSSTQMQSRGLEERRKWRIVKLKKWWNLSLIYQSNSNLHNLKCNLRSWRSSIKAYIPYICNRDSLSSGCSFGRRSLWRCLLQPQWQRKCPQLGIYSEKKLLLPGWHRWDILGKERFCYQPSQGNICILLTLRICCRIMIEDKPVR